MITVIGGIYREVCLHPQWDMLFGSGLRAAVAISALAASNSVELVTWASPNEREDLWSVAESFGVRLSPEARPDAIEFQYDHGLGIPRLYPDRQDIVPIGQPELQSEKVLTFGLVEGQPRVRAQGLVYDPQAGRHARAPGEVGHQAGRLAIVANLREATSMVRRSETILRGVPKEKLPAEVGKALISQEGCEVVVVKNGAAGAAVVTGSDVQLIESYETSAVFPIGSGDVFSAVFAWHWLEGGRAPEEAARLASLATAYYCEHKALPVPTDLKAIGFRPNVASPPRLGARVYLAGPLFTLPQLWLLNEAKRCLEEQGLGVFSPKDEVGFLASPAGVARVASQDLAGLESSDLVFAILDGLDAGTLFEVGYARAKGIPVIGFSQLPDQRQLTMLMGTGCAVYEDFATAVYKTAWAAGKK